MSRAIKPPPVLGTRVLANALLGRGVQYSGHSGLFVEGKELGPVPRLAICERPDGGVLLVHCNRRWSELGLASYESVSAAKQRAEAIYRGSSTCWVAAKVTKAQAERYLRELWAGQECNLCGRRPDQVERLVEQRQVRICNVCVDECHAAMHPSFGSSGR
jgi:hypothetical protein